MHRPSPAGEARLNTWGRVRKSWMPSEQVLTASIVELWCQKCHNMTRL